MIKQISRLAVALIVIAGCSKPADKPAPPPADTVAPAPAPAPPPAPTPAPALKPAPAPVGVKPPAAPAAKITVPTADVDNVDFVGHGQNQQVNLVVDTLTNVAYAHGNRPVTCKDGTVVQAPILMAVYGDNNKFGRPVGSGWYAADLAPGQCGAKENVIYGRRFDANGNITAEGFAKEDPKTKELVVVTINPKAP